jgi:phage terminase large subunit GpA-like protein
MSALAILDEDLDFAMTPDEELEMKNYLRSMVGRMAFVHPYLTIPEYAEKYIRIQTGPKTGQFSLSSFPPIEEPLFHMGPQSKKQYVFIMASIQTLKTICLDIIAQYYTDHSPQDQLFVSANERAGKKWRIRRYEPMMNSSGVRERRHIGAFHETNSSRRSGETMWSIEYEGKTLDVGTAQSAMSLSSDTKRILLADEISRWPEDVGKEGHPWQIAVGRTTAWGHMAKTIAVSSPLIDGMCKMQELYMTGDGRKYLATCPYCGKGQILERGSPESKSGLKWETKAGRNDYSTLRYVCDFCDESIFEHQKLQMLQKHQAKPIRFPEREPDIPRWESTQTADEEFIVSYQIGSIYSPFFSWRTYASEYRKAVKNPEKMQTFVNQRDGLPYKIVGVTPDIEQVVQLRGTYASGEIPHEVLFLTAAVDVQHGQEGWESDDTKKPPRLEMEIKGHGEGYRQFSIRYERFTGYLDDIYSGAWAKFREFIEGGGFSPESRGAVYPVRLCLIDAGSSKYNDQIYNFCREMGVLRFSPVLGFNTLKRKRDAIAGKESGDATHTRDYDRFRRKQENDIILYEVSTYLYKVALYTRLNTSINWMRERPGERTPAGFCGFPSDYQDSYFEMLLSEEHLPDKMKFSDPKGPNEGLDLTVYNMACGEIFLYQQVIFLRAKFQAMKVPAPLLAGISAAFIIRMLKGAKAKGRQLTAAEIRYELKNGAERKRKSGLTESNSRE